MPVKVKLQKLVDKLPIPNSLNFAVFSLCVKRFISVFANNPIRFHPWLCKELGSHLESVRKLYSSNYF